MIGSSIVWILIVSGVVTALAGLGGFLVPVSLLRLVFGVDRPENATAFFVRHWGLLICIVGALVVYSAYAPMTRRPILIAAAIEKAAIVAMVFFGGLKRTPGMTLLAAGDGLFTLLYVAYLAGL
jgi:hypothetical protein